MESNRQQSLFDYLEKKEGSDRPRVAETQLAALEEACRTCNLCTLRSGCRQVVFGDGSPRARLMLVGEGPGADEDRLGKPFIGAAGKLLDRILEAAGLNRDELYITNVVKCRPPRNRLPDTDEVARCLPHLKEQIRLIDPPLIVCLGALATRTMIGSKDTLTRLRGRWYEIEGRRYMPTFHPAALLRDSSKKRPVWEDFKEIAFCYQQITSGG
ncbi:MAG: uracil-DNA glycosylase [Dethiobacteria bacterium]|nr:uracil-DNA glycosylase [Bacillota bacterium]HOB28683.1 uracil-DNA glycosylase [Bacillota bacterium]HPZ41371.1 uracil-DNA glycosylase [Bacillota bacterium]HQD52320.1 uracil-DNA glycosylase [Bacillota bacterium]